MESTRKVGYNEGDLQGWAVGPGTGFQKFFWKSDPSEENAFPEISMEIWPRGDRHREASREVRLP